MSIEEEIRLRLEEERRRQEVAENQKREAEAKFWLSLEQAWKSYVFACHEIVRMFEQADVPSVPLFEKREKVVGIFSKRTVVNFVESGRGWVLDTVHRDQNRLFCIIGDDGKIYQEHEHVLKHPSGMGRNYSPGEYHAYHMPFDPIQMHRSKFRSSDLIETSLSSNGDGDLIFYFDRSAVEAGSSSVNAIEELKKFATTKLLKYS